MKDLIKQELREALRAVLEFVPERVQLKSGFAGSTAPPVQIHGSFQQTGAPVNTAINRAREILMRADAEVELAGLQKQIDAGKDEICICEIPFTGMDENCEVCKAEDPR